MKPNKNEIQYDDKGSYRIVYADGTTSCWHQYHQVITDINRGRKFIAFSTYWNGCGKFNMVGVHEIKSPTMSEEHVINLDVDQILANPYDYTLTRSALGWTVSTIDGENGLLLTEREAEIMLNMYDREDSKGGPV